MAIKHKNQLGGWSPSLMASFAVNGMRLLPVAGYMGYKMFKNNKTMKRRGKTRGTRKRRYRLVPNNPFRGQ